MASDAGVICVAVILLDSIRKCRALPSDAHSLPEFQFLLMK